MEKQNKTICTIILIGLNAAVFGILLLLGKTEDTLFIMEHGAMYEPYLTDGQEYYRLVTSMFLHFGFEHLMNNMIMLGAIGMYLEPAIGKIRFLLIYFVSGIGGNILSFYMNLRQGRSVVSAGASGAVFGLMGALVFAVLWDRKNRIRLDKRRILFMVVLSLYFGFTSTGVDNAAHVGGLICGFVLCAALLLFVPTHKKTVDSYRV